MVKVKDYNRKVLSLVNSTRVVYASSDEISKVTITQKEFRVQFNEKQSSTNEVTVSSVTYIDRVRLNHQT